MNSQLKMLLSDISGHSSRHLKEIQSDLVQTNMLLDEAITQLTESFEGITKGVGTYQKAIVNLLPSEAMEQSPDRLQNIVRLNAVNEILALKEAVARDIEAINFVKELSLEYVGSKKTLNKLKNGENINL